MPGGEVKSLPALPLTPTGETPMYWYVISWGGRFVVNAGSENAVERTAPIIQVSGNADVLIAYSGLPITPMPWVAEGI